MPYEDDDDLDEAAEDMVDSGKSLDDAAEEYDVDPDDLSERFGEEMEERYGDEDDEDE
jgi:hypothetical protein